MTRIIAIAASAASFLAVAGLLAVAAAQDFRGDCTALKQSKEACTASGWCRWVEKKPVTLPNGQTFQPAAVCQFKPNHKEAWKQQAASK